MTHPPHITGAATSPQAAPRTASDIRSAPPEASPHSRPVADRDEDLAEWPEWSEVWAKELQAEQKRKEIKEQALATRQLALEAKAVAVNRQTRAHEDVPDEEIQRTAPRDLRPRMIEVNTGATAHPPSAPWRAGSREPARSEARTPLFDRTQISREHQELCRKACAWKKLPWAKRLWDRMFASSFGGVRGVLPPTEDPARLQPSQLRDFISSASTTHARYAGGRDQEGQRSSSAYDQQRRSYPWRGQRHESMTQSYSRTESPSGRSMQQQPQASRSRMGNPRGNAYVDTSINYRGRETAPRTMPAASRHETRATEFRPRRTSRDESTSSRPSAAAANETSWTAGWSTDTGSQYRGSSGSAGEEREPLSRRWHSSSQRSVGDNRRSQPHRGASSQPPSAMWWHNSEWQAK